MKTQGYSLWLVPEPNTVALSSLRRVINELARVYRSPVFEPHVTLLGGVEDTEENSRRKVGRLAETLPSLCIDLNEVDSKGTYLQALFVMATRTRSLIRANIVSKINFGVPMDECYLPHLSLAYGTFGDAEIATLKRTLKQLHPLLQDGKSFIAKKVQLWHVEGEVAEWHLVAEFPLTGKELSN